MLYVSKNDCLINIFKTGRSESMNAVNFAALLHLQRPAVVKLYIKDSSKLTMPSTLVCWSFYNSFSRFLRYFLRS